MKVLLLVTIILLVYVNLATSAAVIVKRDQSLEDSYSDINVDRNQTAERLRIANMHKLTWSPELAAKAKQVPTLCSKVANGEDYVFFVVEKKNDKGPKSGPPRQISDLKGIPFLWPGQTKFGCDPSFVCLTGGVEWQGLCFIGPQTVFDPADFKEGAPGSACGDFKNEGGLCGAAVQKNSVGFTRPSAIEQSPPTAGQSIVVQPTAAPSPTTPTDNGVSSLILTVSFLISILAMF